MTFRPLAKPFALLPLLGVLLVLAFALWVLAAPTTQADSDWQKRAPIPTARSEITATAVDGKIYVLGGIGPTTRSTFEVYNSRTNSWQQLPKLPEKRHHVAKTAYQGAIYAAGGFSNLAFNRSANSWRYDIDRRHWMWMIRSKPDKMARYY